VRAREGVGVLNP